MSLIDSDASRLRQHMSAIEKALALTDDPTMPAAVTAAVGLGDKLIDAKRPPFDMDDAADRLLAAKDPTAELERLAEEHARHNAVVALVDEMAAKAALVRPLHHALAGSLTEVADRLRPLVEAAAADLAEHSPNLPESEHPLAQASTVLHAGPAAATAWARCTDAVGVIEKVAAAFDGRRLDGAAVGVSQGGSKVTRLLPVLAPPEVMEHEHYRRWTHDTVQGDDELEAHRSVRGFVAAVIDYGPSAALVRAARGEFPGWSYNVTADFTEMRNRAGTVRRALLRLPEPDPAAA